MDLVTPILTVLTDLFGRTSRICELPENLESLKEEMETMIRRSEDVKRRVELAQQHQMGPRSEVEGWLDAVEKEKSEVEAIRQKGYELLEQRSPGRCLSICSSYKLGGRVIRKIKRVRELTSRGDFKAVEFGVLRAVVDELPVGEAVGLDSLYTEVCSCLADDEVGIVGLYGRRGTGKTTLLKKINNGLLGTEHHFDIVIWVSVEKTASEKAAQEVIGNRLRIIDDIWPNRNQDEKAIEIFKVMKTKRFLLFLDNVYEPLDLPEIGVPLPDAQNRSKVIIASIFPGTCKRMKSGRLFQIRPLETQHAWSLFIDQLQGVARTIAHHDTEVQILAYSILDMCEGFPPAIIRAGRASAHFKTHMEWQESRLMLLDLIKEEISGTEDRQHNLFNNDKMPLGYTVGFDSLYVRVCISLKESQGGLIGLYGTGGVGKTTLMKMIYNECSEKMYGFNTAIWVAMSKQGNVGAAQEVIRNKLKIPDSMWQSRSVDERAREIFKIMKTKTFLLLIDDVWQPIDLQEIGVPPLLEAHSGSKVIIATRFQNICNEMEIPVQRQFKVEVLAEEDALALFVEKVGQNTLSSHPDIPQLAEKVAERCKGLPLALVTTGRAMANKNSPEAWDQAIQELEKFPAKISGMEDGLFHVLKLSYDSLRDDITKSCFVYYSCFPKRYEIRSDELIEHWIGEGFIDCEDIHEARLRGHKIIDDLKNACLLEESDHGFKECIKMHDVIHDMALWIGQECGKKMKEILVYESLGLADAERGTYWSEAKTLSLWGEHIEKLPKAPHCSNLRTLFVRECIQLRTFPLEFFNFMPLLRVLDLSTTHGLTKLPDEIERLINLEYVNLSMTHIKELPTGIMKLKRLRCFILNGMLSLLIPPHLISSFSSLQLFSMYDGNALSEHHATLLEELECIVPLDEICLSFRSAVALNKLLNSHKLQRCIRRLSIYLCQDLVLFVLSPMFLNHLETLEIFHCLHLQEMIINVGKEGRNDSKETYDIPNPTLIVRSNKHFHRLCDVKIWSCPRLLNLTWLVFAAQLQSLNVQFCNSMREVISYQYKTSSTQLVNVFTRLKSLVLGAMPMLESIYRGQLLFPSLEVISVINCPKLGRLPFNSNGLPKSLKKIEGDLTWWARLQWEDEIVGSGFTEYFSPQYLANPEHSPGEMKGKKKHVTKGSTS